MQEKEGPSVGAYNFREITFDGSLTHTQHLWAVQIMAHSGAHFLDAPQQERAEGACLLDLSEHWFHHLLS
jgi:hypothetical protein